MVNDMLEERQWYVCRRRHERLQTGHVTKVHKEMILETRSHSYARMWVNRLSRVDVTCKYYLTDHRLKYWADMDEIDKLGMPAGAK